MALSHVERTRNPAVAWKYMIKSETLGGSYALYAANIACLALLIILGRFYSSSCRDIRQIRGPMDSRQPLRKAAPCLLHIITASRVKVTAQSASHRGPLLLRCGEIQELGDLWWKIPMGYGVRIGCPSLRIVVFAPLLYIL